MGYILPIQPIQSQLYANRMDIESYDFAIINRVGKVKFKSGFSDHMNDNPFLDGNDDEKAEVEDKPVVASSLPPYKGFIHPNPVNLSPAIAQVVGKGMSVNLYV